MMAGMQGKGLMAGALFWTVLAVLAPAQEPEAPPAQRPRSVLFYLVDTCRDDHLAFEGYGRETTPFLKWLAERSVVFENCSGQAAWTKPAMASMLTSQYPSTTGIYRMEQRLPGRFVTWPEVLQANGVYTIGFSANIVMGNLLSNFAQGFDRFVESTEVNRGDPIRFASGSAKKLNRHVFEWLDGTDVWPMLVYVHSVDPHEEYEPEPEYLERFADPARHAQYREDWKKLLESRPPIPGLHVTQANFDRTGVDSAAFLEYGRRLYDADLLANDDQIQRLWNKLQKDGWGRDFIFVFTSDHGEEFFEHGGTSHGYTLYGEMTHVPLMIYAPGLLPAGKRIETPVRSLDIYPTLCELLGFEIPAGLEGRSLVPLIEGRGEEPREIFSEHREDPVLRRLGEGSGDLVSLRSGHWKLILNPLSSQTLPRPRFELFDLDADPGETTNVAAAHPEVVKRLEPKARAFIAKHWKGKAARETGAMEPEVEDQLRQLGYLGTEEEDAARLEKDTGITPLTLAALNGDLDRARVLLEAGTPVDARNKDGSTPLSAAALLGKAEMVRFLLKKGADPAAKNAQGASVLDATQAPWEITEFVAGLFGIRPDRAEVEAGRKKCAELLNAALKARNAEIQDHLTDSPRQG